MVVALASSAVSAQMRSASDYGFYEGDKEFIINGGGVASDDFDTNTFSLNAQLGWVGGDDIADSIFAGPEGGAKFFLNDTTFLVGQVAYQYFFDDEDDITFDNGRWVYSIGMGLRF